MARRKVNIGDTVYLVTEHYYRRPGRAGALMEYMPIEGTVTDIITINRAEAKIKTIEDGMAALHFLNVSGYGKTFFSDRESAVALAERISDAYDRKWEKFDGEPIRRPWRERQ